VDWFKEQLADSPIFDSKNRRVPVDFPSLFWDDPPNSNHAFVPIPRISQDIYASSILIVGQVLPVSREITM